jgi:hypothetical protein
VLGAEIWVMILAVDPNTLGDPPLTRDGRFASNCDVVASCVKGPDTFRFVALDPGHEYASRAGTQTPYTLDFDAADGGLPLTRRDGRDISDRLSSAKRLRRVKGKNAHYLLR